MSINRRSFLKSLATAALACALPGRAWAGLPRTDTTAGLVRLYNIHTAEKATIRFRAATGDYIEEGLAALNHLLRCHHTNQVHAIDIAAIEYLHRVDQALGGNNEFHVISGYRSPAYNAFLRSKGSGVAKNSLHLKGRALDVRLPGKDLKVLRNAALALRMGGVGFYPASDFIHLDSGPFRTW